MAGRAIPKAPQLGAWLRARRTAQGLSMEDLAVRLRTALHPQKINRSQIKWWEAGRVPSYTQMCAIADALGIAQADILSRVRDEMGAGYIAAPPDLRLIHKKNTAGIRESPDRSADLSATIVAHLRSALDDAAQKIATLEQQNAELSHRLDLVRAAAAAIVAGRPRDLATPHPQPAAHGRPRSRRTRRGREDD